jgi:long-chain acyl-CoA synthetase
MPEDLDTARGFDTPDRPDTPDVWVFDVDGCLIDSMSGSSLRPLAESLIVGLRARDITVVLWSAGGADYARRRARQVGIEAQVSAFYGKATRDGEGRWSIEHFLPAHRQAIFVDDQPDEVPRAVQVIGVSPYIGENPHDRGLAAALEVVVGAGLR